MAALANRPAWQVLLLAFGTVVGTLATVVLVVLVATVTEPLSPLDGRLHQAVVGIPLVLAIYAGVARLLGVPAREVRAARPGFRILGWVAIGLAVPLGLLAIQLGALGAVAVGDPPSVPALVGAVAVALLAGLFAGVLEELALRGALLRLLERRWGQRTAVVGSAAVFAALHQGHAPSPAALGAVVVTMFAAGLWLGVATVRSGSVWAAVALHAGWNTVHGGRLVAVARPGQPAREALLAVRFPTADPLLSGGAAGLTAAPLTTVGLLLATAALLVVDRRTLSAGAEAA